jgi:hypothetical protein
MDALVTVIFAICSNSDASDYDWDCVHYLNNCAIERSSKIEQKKIDECAKRWKYDSNKLFSNGRKNEED